MEQWMPFNAATLTSRRCCWRCSGWMSSGRMARPAALRPTASPACGVWRPSRHRPSTHRGGQARTARPRGCSICKSKTSRHGTSGSSGYAEVMETVFAHADAIDLTENHIKQFHRDLPKYPRKTTGIAAHTRRCQSRQRSPMAISRRRLRDGDALRHAAPDGGTGAVDTRRARRKELHPLLCIAIFIVAFLASTRSRTATPVLLTTLLLLRAAIPGCPTARWKALSNTARKRITLPCAARKTRSARMP